MPISITFLFISVLNSYETSLTKSGACKTDEQVKNLFSTIPPL